MSCCRFATDPAGARGLSRRPPGYVVVLPGKEEYLASSHTDYYPPGY